MQSKQEKKTPVKATVIEPIHGEREDIVIENFRAKNNMLTAKVKKADFEFMLMHSSYNPDKEAENIASKFDYTTHGLYIIFGIGLGFHLEKILKKVSSKSIIVVIEQSKNVYDNFLKNIKSNFLLSDTRVIVINSIKHKSIASALEAVNNKDSLIATFSHNIQYTELNYHKMLFEGVSSCVMQDISEIARMKWKQLGNCHVDHNIGVIQPILNIDELIDNVGVKDVRNCYEGKAAIIVSAGPSLDKNMKYLAEAKGKIFIAAVDAVLPKLLKNNIIPDAVVTVERLSVYNNILKNRDCDIPESIVLMAPALTEVNTLKVFKKNNKIFFFQSGVGTQLYYDETLNKGITTSGTSAAYTALSFCAELGFKKIAFVGQDLAYAEDGRVYCDGISKEGNVIEEQRQKESWYTAYVKDYNGKDIPSNIIWKDQLITFKLFIKVNVHIKIYDATEGGALIEGSEIITLKQYIKENEQNQLEDINVIIKNKKDNMKDLKENIISELYERLLKDYKSFEEMQDSIGEHLNSFSQINERYVVANKKFTKVEIDKIVRLIDISQNITEKISQSRFLNLYYQGLIMNFRKEINQIAERDFEKSLRLHIKIHYDFFELLYPIFKLNLCHIKFLVEFLETKLNNEPLNYDIIEILKKIIRENGIDPEFIYNYFGIKKEDDVILDTIL